MRFVVSIIVGLVIAMLVLLLGFRLMERVLDHGRFSAPKAEAVQPEQSPE